MIAGGGGGSIRPGYRSYSMYSERQSTANSVGPDHTCTLQNAASDQFLHCLSLIQHFKHIHK